MSAAALALIDSSVVRCLPLFNRRMQLLIMVTMPRGVNVLKIHVNATVLILAKCSFLARRFLGR